MNLTLTNKQLKTAFLNLNDRFFDGKISELTIVKFGDIKEDGLFQSDTQFGCIQINKRLKAHPDFVTLVLLHEMVHAYLAAIGHLGYEMDKGHGSRFHVEIDRLYQKGAYEGLL